jgi:ABC-type methionine transport system permease subunit
MIVIHPQLLEREKLTQWILQEEDKLLRYFPFSILFFLFTCLEELLVGSDVYL